MKLEIMLIALLLTGLVGCTGASPLNNGTTPSPTSSSSTPQDQTQGASGQAAGRRGESPVSIQSTMDTPTPVVETPNSTSGRSRSTGLLATIPRYAELDLGTLAVLASQTLGGEVLPSRIQALVHLTPQDEAYLVVALDTGIDGTISAGTVEGVRVPLPTAVSQEMHFLQGTIIADRITLMKPVETTPQQVNQDRARYAFQRVTWTPPISSPALGL